MTEAAELYETHRSVRALGMGNAFVSLVDGDEALFLNPAGLARNGGFFWTIIDPAGGINDTALDEDVLDSVDGLSSDVTSEFTAAVNGLYGEPLWGGLNSKTALVTPFFTAAYFYDVDVSLQINNPAAPELLANIVYDQGIAAGAGLTMGFVEVGGVFKRIERTGGRQLFGPGEIASIAAGGANTVSDLLDQEGIGYAFDFGMNFTVPGPFSPTLSFVWKNIGDTSFRADAGETEPTKEEQEFIVGGSVLIDAGLAHVVPSFDFKHLDNHNAQIGKRVHLGVEVGLPLIDLRAGYHQGYLSYGAGFSLGFLRIDAASWGVELGEYPGQLEDRRYMVQASLQLGFDLGLSSSPRSSSNTGLFGGGGGSASEGGSGGKGGGKSRSRWRGNKSRR